MNAPRNGQQQPQQLPADAEPIVCVGCASDKFKQVFKLFSITNPIGFKREMVAAPVMVCDICGLEVGSEPAE